MNGSRPPTRAYLVGPRADHQWNGERHESLGADQQADHGRRRLARVQVDRQVRRDDRHRERQDKTRDAEVRERAPLGGTQRSPVAPVAAVGALLADRVVGRSHRAGGGVEWRMARDGVPVGDDARAHRVSRVTAAPTDPIPPSARAATDMPETRPGWATMVRWSATLVGIALAAFLGLLFLAAIGRVLVWVMIALFLALALDRGVRLLERVLPRRFAVLAVFVAAIAAIGGIAVLVVPPLVDQVRQFADELPAMIDKLSRGRGPLGVLEKRFDIVEHVRDAVASGGPGTALGLTGPVFAAVSRVAQTVIGVLAITFLTLFMLLRGPSWWQAFIGSCRSGNGLSGDGSASTSVRRRRLGLRRGGHLARRRDLGGRPPADHRSPLRTDDRAHRGVAGPDSVRRRHACRPRRGPRHAGGGRAERRAHLPRVPRRVPAGRREPPARAADLRPDGPARRPGASCWPCWSAVSWPGSSGRSQRSRSRGR